MSLRVQLLLVALLTLVLPWAGCQYVQEMESALRRGQQDALLSSAGTIASALGNRADLLYTFPEQRDHLERRARYIYAMDRPVIIDGYAGDWGLDSRYFTEYLLDDAFNLKSLVATDGRLIYLFFEVRDRQIVYRREQSVAAYEDELDPAMRVPPGAVDQVWIVIEDPAGKQHVYEISTAAPGPVYAWEVDRAYNRLSRQTRIRGEWQDTASGYNVELRLPVSMVGSRLGYAVVDAVEAGDADLRWVGNLVNVLFPQAPVLVTKQDALEQQLRNYEQDQIRLQVVDHRGWILGSIGGTTHPSDSTSMTLIHRIYRAILSGTSPEPEPTDTPGRLAAEHVARALSGEPNAVWYQPASEGRAVISAAYPITTANGEVSGAVILDRASDAILTLTNEALTRLINFTLLATLIASIALLGYATILSIRIRRLRDAAEGALASDGTIRATMIPSRTPDEIGDLSRSFAGLMHRLREYTEYLRTLASKLSHELRTPLAVVQSSLENLEQRKLDDETRTYAHRASEGTERLSKILTAMSESTRVEQAIETADPETFDLTTLIKEMGAAYRDVFIDRVMIVETPQAACPLHGVPELITQMLDKLVDNAVDFSQRNSTIRIDLIKTGNACRLSVSNQGPPLPETMREQLFDPMVSIRDKRGGSPHLGLGLFIVRLIVAYHRGQIEAHNLSGDNGVRFDVTLPLVQ